MTRSGDQVAESPLKELLGEFIAISLNRLLYRENLSAFRQFMG